MRSEFSLRFEPASGAKFVAAHAYVRALDQALEGLSSLRGVLAPELAATNGWALPQVRDALAFAIGPNEKGSLIVPLIAGGGSKGAPLPTDAIAQEFWKQTSAELARLPRGRATRLSANGAEALARASAAAKESSAKLSFATKKGREAWQTLVPITSLEAKLRKHAAAQREGHRAQSSVSGQIVSLTFDPPGFVLVSAASRRTVRMPSALRDKARSLWGCEVVVLTEGVLASNGELADLQALDIRPVATARAGESSFEETFGLMRGVWDSDEVGARLGEPRH